MIPFTVLKEYPTIYVRSRNSNYELRSKVVFKQKDKEPSLLFTKVFTTKEGAAIETTKLGRIPFQVLEEILKIVSDSQKFITEYLLQNHFNNGKK